MNKYFKRYLHVNLVKIAILIKVKEVIQYRFLYCWLFHDKMTKIYSFGTFYFVMLFSHLMLFNLFIFSSFNISFCIGRIWGFFIIDAVWYKLVLPKWATGFKCFIQTCDLVYCSIERICMVVYCGSPVVLCMFWMVYWLRCLSYFLVIF